MVFGLLLTKSDLDATQFRKTPRAYNAIVSIASMTASSVSSARRSLNSDLVMKVRGNAYHYIGLPIPPQQIKHLYAFVYRQDTDDVEKVTNIWSNISPHLMQTILIDFEVDLTKKSIHSGISKTREWAH